MKAHKDRKLLPVEREKTRTPGMMTALQGTLVLSEDLLAIHCSWLKLPKEMRLILRFNASGTWMIPTSSLSKSSLTGTVDSSKR
jgi:hypothetical protein